MPKWSRRRIANPFLIGSSPIAGPSLMHHRSGSRELPGQLFHGENMPRIYSNKKKESLQLGIPFTTASTRLHRILLFDLAKKSGNDSCFRYQKNIESVKDFSIEHKIAWLDNDPRLFWDLNNIGFSHLSCNKKAGRKPTEWSDAARKARHVKKKLVDRAFAICE